MHNRLGHRQLIHTPLHRRRSPLKRKHLTSSGISIPSRPNTQKSEQRRERLKAIDQGFRDPSTTCVLLPSKGLCSTTHARVQRTSKDVMFSPSETASLEELRLPRLPSAKRKPLRVPPSSPSFSEPTKSIELPGPPIPSQYTLPKQVHQ